MTLRLPPEENTKVLFLPENNRSWSPEPERDLVSGGREVLWEATPPIPESLMQHFCHLVLDLSVRRSRGEELLVDGVGDPCEPGVGYEG